MNLRLPAHRFYIQELIYQDTLGVLEEDVRAGLLTVPRSLPPKYFYDDEGSKLFNAICETQDYYLMRTEFALLKKHAKEIIEHVQARTCVELGAGTSAKTEILLSELHAVSSVVNLITIDVCKEVLVESANRLLNKFSRIQIQSIVGEYIPALQAVPDLEGPALYIFIGSSIGNFTEEESVELLTQLAQKMQPYDYFLLGLDRIKDKRTLEKAYDDCEGVTAKFNLNVLRVLNKNLDANFKLEQFFHQAIYNEKDEQVEMYLVSKQDQVIEISALDETIQLRKHEKILTETSRKYSKSSIQRMLAKSGLDEQLHFESENEYFSLVLTKLKIRPKDM